MKIANQSEEMSVDNDPAAKVINGALPLPNSLKEPQLYYVFNHTDRKHIFIHPSLEALLGYEILELKQVRLDDLWHKNDLKVFCEQVSPAISLFLGTKLHSDYNSLSFCFNYRIQTKKGNYLTLLERCKYVDQSQKDAPLLAVATVVDITNYKEDSRIIYTVELLEDYANTCIARTLVKSIHYPDKTFEILTKRELEILEKMFRGLTSKDIANILSISINTVNNHRKNMLQKTKTTNSTELFRFAQKNGLIY
jgi:DNA-binding CsgD family transcriptional regulator